jgi:hypothetical protein
VTILEEALLMRIRDSLTSFGNFSGLECNFDKSNILLTFVPTQDEVRLVDRTGFKLTNSIKLLGVDICSDLNNVDDIFEKILQKITNLVSFWERFKLSIPGRITIAKTFLVSQLNYVGCFLTPSDDMIDRLQRVLDNFIKKFEYFRIPDPETCYCGRTGNV